jgi:replication-associated recombination protein RarA
MKYAPASIDEVVFNNPYYEQDLKMIFQGFKCKHLFLSGTNGNGKTTLANLIANHLTKHCPYLLMHESIETVMAQKDIRDFFSRTLYAALGMEARRGDRVVIVFNELDKYEGSLDRLWTAMDRLTDELLVIITTNNPMKFENAIRSRCDKYSLSRITPEQFLPRAQNILKQEGVTLPDRDVLHYLTVMTIKTSDVRDYLSVLDKLIFMVQNNMPLLAVPTQTTVGKSLAKGTLSRVK